MRLRFSGADCGTSHRSVASRAAITLVEMLVAMAITLLLMASVVQVFDLLGTAVAGSRATMEMTDRVRQAQHLLQSDLAAISRPVVPWVTDEEGGYFEYAEGGTVDKDYLGSGGSTPGPITVRWGGDGYTTSSPGFTKHPTYDFVEDATSKSPARWARFTPTIPLAGPYLVKITCNTRLSFRSNSVPITIVHASGTASATQNQMGPEFAFKTDTYGPYDFNVGAVGSVTVSNSGTAAGTSVNSQQVVFEYAGPVPPATADSRLGDIDDQIAFTATRDARPFQGRVETAGGVNMIESPTAEIVWACGEDSTAATANRRTVYRRVLLVAPWAASMIPAGDLSNLATFQQKHDLSARWDGSQVVLNTLEDLALRENRYRHAAAYPHAMQTYAPLTGGREGEDVVLVGALALDVRIFDPNAPIYAKSDGIAYGPSDQGYDAASAALGDMLGAGCYVDLGYTKPTHSLPNGEPLFAGGPGFFDTWPSRYERDGKTQVSGRTDWSTDGLDNDAANGVDDTYERETNPPYPHAPQGIQVKLRAYENDARTIREVTVNQDFGS